MPSDGSPPKLPETPFSPNFIIGLLVLVALVSLLVLHADIGPSNGVPLIEAIAIVAFGFVCLIVGAWFWMGDE